LSFLGSFAFLAFSRLFHLFYHWNFHLLLVWGCDPSQDFYERKFIHAKKGTIRDIFISERERNNKDGLSLFQTHKVNINKFWPRLERWFGLCKEMHFMSLWVIISLDTIIHTFKIPGLRVMGWGWRFIFYSCILV